MPKLRSIVKGTVNAIFHLIYKFEVNGLENIPKEGAYLLCSNHIHAFDSIAYALYIKRMMYIMAKEEIFNNKFSNWFMRKMGCFPVKRGSASEEAINKSVDYLNEGYLVFIFPEGTRNGLEKGIKPKKGAALITLKAQVPIIPMGITGTFKPFSKIKINIGKPISFEKHYSDEINPRSLITITNQTMETIKKLSKGGVKENE